MKIICIGRNYSDHAKEMNAPVPDKPMFFMKPDTAVLKGSNDFYFPEFSNEIHYECELVVRISKVGKNISEKFAHKYYDEIGLGIDFTARDLQQQCKEKGHPWEIAKAFDNSAVISDKFISKDNFDLSATKFRFFQNGTLKQEGNTKDMIFTIDQLIAYVSKFITLKTGDYLFTGTPSGVGPIAIGDKLEGFLEDQKLFEIAIK